MKVKIPLQNVKQGRNKDRHGLFHVSYNFSFYCSVLWLGKPWRVNDFKVFPET